MPGLFPFDVHVSKGVFSLEPLDFLQPLERPPFLKIAPYLGQPLCAAIFVNQPVRCQSSGQRRAGSGLSNVRTSKSTSWHHPQLQIPGEVGDAEDTGNRGVASIAEASVSYPTIRNP